MAKSIFTLLDDLKTETSVPSVEDKDGNELRRHYGMVNHTLPRSALPTSEQFEDGKKLLMWADDAGILHSCLQKGVKAHVIDCRAILKAVQKDITWTPESGQENLDNFKWVVMTRPNVKVDSKKAIEDARYADCFKAISAGLKQGKDKEMLKEFLTLMYEPELIKACFNAIEKIKAE